MVLPSGSDYQLTDASGKVWSLDESGEVTSVGEKADTQLAQNQAKANLPANQKQPQTEAFEVQWDFSQSAFAYDDTSFEIPYKALVKGKEDTFQVAINQRDTLAYDFYFHTDKGLKINSEEIQKGVYKLTRKGLFDFAQEEVWVVAKEKNTQKEEVINRCVLVHLSEKEVNVVLIPTQQGLRIDTEKIKAIYAKVGVKLNISVDKVFEVAEKISTENAFGDLSTYSKDQQQLINRYTAEHTVKSDAYYVFVGQQEGSQQGYMRLGGQFGFAFLSPTLSQTEGFERTIAHELGHGVFKLEHPFKKDQTKKGSFKTLMDYASETGFAYADWKQINDPKLKLYVFQGQSEGEYNKFDVLNVLRNLRLCKNHSLPFKVNSTAGSGKLDKGNNFFEYTTLDNITLMFKKAGSFSVKNISKNNKNSKYLIEIDDFAVIFCDSEKYRDILFNFLKNQTFDKMLSNTVTIKNKKTYSYNLLYNDLEKIKVDLIKKGKYKNLDENERLLLDLPLIMWSKKWEYGAIFMYNWFMEEGDIEMDNDLYNFYDNWKEFKNLEKEFKKFVDKHKNKKIAKEIEEDKTNKFVLFVHAFRLYALNDLKQYLSKIEADAELKLANDLSNKNLLNFSRCSIGVDLKNINNPYVASFGTFGLGYLFEGEYNKEKEEIVVTNILEQINDSFDFEDDGLNKIYSQPLGSWKNTSIFNYKADIEANYIGGIDNKVFRNFRQKTGIGKDFKIKGIRPHSDKFINTIKINKNEVEYQ